MFLKKKICENCKVGQFTYETDRQSEICPRIDAWRDNKCPFYEPIEQRKSFTDKIKDFISHI